MQNQSTTGGKIFNVIKGVALALAFSLLASIVLASILQCFPLPDKVVYPINQTVKVAAIMLGSLVFVREEKGLLQGVAIGALFTALSYLAFSALGGNFSLSWLIFAELALALFVGAISGAVAVNIRRD